MDCLGKCRQGAISFSRKPAADRKPDAGHKPDAVEPATLKAAVAAGEPADASRRKFLSLVGVMACATVRAQEKKVDGGLAVIEQKKIPRRTTPITRPDRSPCVIWRRTAPDANCAWPCVPTRC